MRRPRTRVCLATVVIGLLVAGALIGPAGAQNPNSCTTSGYSSYSFTFVYDPVANTTTYSFAFCNESPINGIYVNVGEIFLFGIATPVGTPGTPTGWEFLQIGPRLF